MLIKNYEDIISYIFDFELVRDYRLERVQYCADLLGNPQDNYKVIHITGTNGKGSTCNMCFSVLKGRGKKVGIFTSPHLFDIRERFRTQDGMISQEDLITIVNKIIALNIELSYFEKCTLIAFEYFRQQGCEYAVIEVGVGGLLDSTNIVKPIITAITSLGYDHMDLLGSTLDDIAFQKAGIIKPGIPLVMNFHNHVIEEQAHEKGSSIIFTDKHISTNLVGAHQTQNAALAYEITHYLGVPDEIINKGLQKVSHPGRLEYIAPNLLIDGAHNQQGLESLKTYIDTITQDYSQIIYCFSIKKGKEDKIQEYIIERFGKEQKYIIVDHYHNLLAQHNNIIKEINNIEYSIQSPDQIKQLAQDNKNILYVAFGSLYMIGGFYDKKQYRQKKEQSISFTSAALLLLLPFCSKIMKNKISGLSLRRDRYFLRNIVIAVGVILVWRGVWHITDMYLFPNNELISSIASCIIGILILYLPDGHLEHLGGYKPKDDKKKESYILYHNIVKNILQFTRNFHIIKYYKFYYHYLQNTNGKKTS